ncbi:MAG: response regulator [Chloroflexi bacterium]|nr:response regulator [Chloroflexota bacterium]
MKTILIASDDALFARRLREYLRGNDYRVALAGSMRSVEAILRQVAIAIIIADEAVLELSDTAKSLQNLRQLSSHAPLLLIADHIPSFLQDNGQKECHGLLQKPVDLQELLKKVSRIVGTG